MSEKDMGVSPRGISFQGRMKISWAVNSDNDPVNTVDQNQRNGRLLQALLVSLDSHHDTEDESGELARVEAKLDLLLDMVSRLLQHTASTAIESEVEIWLEGLSWSLAGQTELAVNQQLTLFLYLDSHLTQPLELIVSVTEVRLQEHGSEVEARFVGQSEQVSDLIAKYIFRQHRRIVAQEKAKRRIRRDEDK
ncbi:MAG: PilZ domain-containing protein [Sedimenticola sp.]|nr:PilZ domain-containing protein [Sedimenticola sp.]